ncbi:MAG: SLC13 family permease [Clostridia bacterium]|nr:SLC13 family permease [Clostridia bacterium]
MKKKFLHFLIAIAIDLIISLLVPAANGLTEIGVRTLGAAAAVIYLWLFVGVDWTSLLAIVLFALAGTLPFSTILANSAGSIPVLFIVTMSAISIALQESGVLNRLINWFITRKLLRGRPWLFLGFFFAAVYIVSCFMDIAACCLIALPIAKEVCREIGYQDDDKFSIVMCLSVIWFGMWGYAATPISHTVAIIVMGLIEQVTGVTVSVFDFMKVGIPGTLALCVASFLVFRFILRPDVSKFVNYDPEARRSAAMPRKMSKAEKRTLTVFILVVLAFLFPDLTAGILPSASAFVGSLTIGTPAILGVAALVLIRADGKPLLDFNVAVKKIPWSAVMLVIGMFVMAPCLTADSTGIKVWIANLLSPLTSGSATWFALTFVVTAFCAISTNFMSCNAVANIVYSLVGPVALALAPTVNPIALGIVVAIAANIGIMTPAASAASAVVLGNGVSTVDGMRWGALMIPISIIICLLIVYPLALTVFPF